MIVFRNSISRVKQKTQFKTVLIIRIFNFSPFHALKRRFQEKTRLKTPLVLFELRTIKRKVKLQLLRPIGQAVRVSSSTLPLWPAASSFPRHL